jgi:hypothetical protein
MKQIKYVMYPENFMRNNPPLNIENYKTLPFGCDNHSKHRYYYPNGQCCRPECKKTWRKFNIGKNTKNGF